jgi:single-stranded-DNA-specific exonuclease
MAVAGVDAAKLNTRSLGFALGPRMNAAGRLETAQIALDMLVAADAAVALEKAQQLDDLNRARRADQDIIVEQAIMQAEIYKDSPVLVVSGAGWNHGIVGIVAAKLLEKYKKPTFVLEEMGDESKGSARSYGDFSAADAIRASDDIITKGGGHKLAAGVTMPTANIAAFRQRVNEFYRAQKLFNQQQLLLPKADTIAVLGDVTEQLVSLIATLEPFGNGNPEPLFELQGVRARSLTTMGASGQHVRGMVVDQSAQKLPLVAFGWAGRLDELAEATTLIGTLNQNEWRGVMTIQLMARRAYK